MTMNNDRSDKLGFAHVTILAGAKKITTNSIRSGSSSSKLMDLVEDNPGKTGSLPPPLACPGQQSTRTTW
jgi:hypothetical protein